MSGGGSARPDAGPLVGTAGQIVWDPSVSGKIALVGKGDLPGWVLVGAPQRPAGSGAHLAEALSGLDVMRGVAGPCK